jgi:hypothetical protein
MNDGDIGIKEIAFAVVYDVKWRFRVKLYNFGVCQLHVEIIFEAISD